MRLLGLAGRDATRHVGQVIESGNQPAQPLEESHQVLWTRLSEPTVKRSMWSAYRWMAATWPPGLPTPPETLNQPAQPVVSCHQVL